MSTGCLCSDCTAVPHHTWLSGFDNYHMLAERGQPFCDGFDNMAGISDRDWGQLVEDVKMVRIGIEEITVDLISFVWVRSQRVMEKAPSQAD